MPKKAKNRTQKHTENRCCNISCVCGRSFHDFRALFVGAMPCMGLKTARLRGGHAWGALTLQGFVGAMHCMGLTHTSSLNSREKSVGGGGCLECAVARAARHTPT